MQPFQRNRSLRPPGSAPGAALPPPPPSGPIAATPPPMAGGTKPLFTPPGGAPGGPGGVPGGPGGAPPQLPPELPQGPEMPDEVQGVRNALQGMRGVIGGGMQPGAPGVQVPPGIPGGPETMEAQAQGPTAVNLPAMRALRARLPGALGAAPPSGPTSTQLASAPAQPPAWQQLRDMGIQAPGTAPENKARLAQEIAARATAAGGGAPVQPQPAMKPGFVGRGGNVQTAGPGRYGGNPPAGRRANLMQDWWKRMGPLAGIGGGTASNPY